MSEKYNANHENIKIRYTVKFEKTVPCVQQSWETREDMIEHIADELFYDNGSAIDGEIKDIDNVEEID